MIRLQIRTHSVRVITATHYVPPPELVLPLLSANMAKACPRLGSRSMTRLALNRRAFARRRASSTVIPLGTSKTPRHSPRAGKMNSITFPWASTFRDTAPADCWVPRSNTIRTSASWFAALSLNFSNALAAAREAGEPMGKLPSRKLSILFKTGHYPWGTIQAGCHRGHRLRALRSSFARRTA
jgi:hypothetical protein